MCVNYGLIFPLFSSLHFLIYAKMYYLCSFYFLSMCTIKSEWDIDGSLSNRVRSIQSYEKRYGRFFSFVIDDPRRHLAMIEICREHCGLTTGELSGSILKELGILTSYPFVSLLFDSEEEVNQRRINFNRQNFFWPLSCSKITWGEYKLSTIALLNKLNQLF